MSKLVIGLILFMLAVNVNAALVEYRIVITQTDFHPVVGVRNLEGTFFVDDSILGAGNENMNYGPFSSAISALTNFTVTVDSPSYQGSGIRVFDLDFTRAVGSPPFSTILATGSSGELIDIQGALTTFGTLSQVILGRDGFEGTYVDVQQTDSVSAVNVSSGTYIIERISPIPIPAAIWLFGSGLIGLIGFARRKKA